jgi:hypothetical protein
VNDGQDDSGVAKVTVLVRADAEPPTIAWVDSAGANDRLTVVFSEPVEAGAAQQPANYAIDNGVQVSAATLASDGTAVTLTTSRLQEGPVYRLTVRNLRDRAAAPNTVAADTGVNFAYVHVGNGLRAEYYDGPGCSGQLIGERLDPDIDVDWRKKLPFEKMQPGKPYSVRWTGRLKAGSTETYMLEFFKGWEHNRNPVRIWIDGKLLSNESFGPVSLQAGKVHELKVELSILRPELSQYADIYKLQWSSLSTPKQVIPQCCLGAPRRKDGQ